jgi:hypothetical protein
MATVGEQKIRFGRSYVFLNPSVGSNTYTVGTWRLTDEDISGGDDPDVSALVESGQIAVDNGPVLASQLLYIDANDKLRTAQADSTNTCRVAGAALSGGSPGDTISYTRNQAVTIQNISDRVDGGPTTLEAGKYYYLSASTAGNYTRTPDTTTPGAVVVQVGLAINDAEITIEIQSPILI